MKRTIWNVLYSAWDTFWIRVDMSGSTLRSLLSLWGQGCPPGSGFRTTGRCLYKARTSGSIQIGRHVTLLAAQRSNRVGITQPVLLETFAEGVIELGDHTAASGVVISSRSEVRIGTHVMLGANVRIFDHDFHAVNPEVRRVDSDEAEIGTAPVRIGDDVFIGTQSLVLKGVTIGAASVIAAGSLVCRDIPPGEIWGGNPARKIGEVDSGSERNSPGRG